MFIGLLSQSSSCYLRIMFSWNLMSFIYICNLASLILQAGDIELNSGPRPVDLSSVICAICCQNINGAPNLEAAASCLNGNYDYRLNLRCNDFTTAQSGHARSLNKEIHGSCSQHDNGKAKVITPTHATVASSATPEREQASAAGKTCSVCNKIIQTQHAASDYHCSIPPCDQVCHLTRTCSSSLKSGVVSQQLQDGNANNTVNCGPRRSNPSIDITDATSPFFYQQPASQRDDFSRSKTSALMVRKMLNDSKIKRYSCAMQIMRQWFPLKVQHQPPQQPLS